VTCDTEISRRVFTRTFINRFRKFTDFALVADDFFSTKGQLEHNWYGRKLLYL